VRADQLGILPFVDGAFGAPALLTQTEYQGSYVAVSLTLDDGTALFSRSGHPTSSWIPLLGRNGLVNSGLVKSGLIHQPVKWLLYSEFSVVLALVHVFTFFMVVPIFNSMVRIDKSLIEAAYDAGATGFQTLVNVIIPLAKPGIVIGSIFVITIVMGDFITIGVMGGQQIAAAGKIIETRLNALQFPAAAANAVILLAITFLIITMMSRIVDIRKEL
jgi:putative spermidine/putrescine transport system permease protein